jgi:hypothetical protein
MKVPLRVPIHEGRSLFRHLLREASYLPDDAAQEYVKKLVQLRFRVRAQKGGDTEKWLRKARTSLSILQRANQGEVHPLRKVLHLTYGRIGPRRYELLRPLLKSDDGPENMPTLEKEMQRVGEVAPASWDLTTVPVPAIFQVPPLRNKRRTGDWVEFKLSPVFSKLTALAHSQKETNPPSTRPTLKKDMFQMPALNTWGRNMPRCRARNMVHDWRAGFLDRLLPPLPEQEWLRLQGLVQGTIKWEGCKPRRKRPIGKPDILSFADVEKFVHVELDEHAYLGAEIEASNQDLPDVRALKLQRLAGDGAQRRYWTSTDNWLAEPESIAEAEEETLLDELRLTRPLQKKSKADRGHTITLRFMIRQWTRIFAMCPLLTPLVPEGPTGKKWKVTWGTTPTSLSTSSAFAPLFQGTASKPTNRVTRPQLSCDKDVNEVELRV